MRGRVKTRPRMFFQAGHEASSCFARCGRPVGADLRAARRGPSFRTARPEVGPYRGSRPHKPLYEKPYLRKSRGNSSTRCALLPGVRHLAAPGKEFAAEGRTADSSPVTRLCTRRAHFWGAAGSRTSGSGAEVHPHVVRGFRGCGILPRLGGNSRPKAAPQTRLPSLVSAPAGRTFGRGWKPHLRKWRGSSSAGCALLPGGRHLAAPRREFAAEGRTADSALRGPRAAFRGFRRQERLTIICRFSEVSLPHGRAEARPSRGGGTRFCASAKGKDEDTMDCARSLSETAQGGRTASRQRNVRDFRAAGGGAAP